MAARLNPAERTVSESDYEKKFSHRTSSGEAKDLNAQENTPDATWKTATKKKNTEDTTKKKGRFGFVGRRAGVIRKGSALGFIIVMLGIGIIYTSVFAPNIILVNMKEMYTNDLTDATVALNAYYQKIMNYKIGHSNCGDQNSIKCKLSSMSRAQKLAFEKHGFTVLGNKVTQDGRDTGQNGDVSAQPESRYEVSAIIPPVSSGTPVPLATGDMLWAWSQLSDANKALVYGVFNPKSSFFMDTKFKQQLKTKYGLSKTINISGNSEQAVNQSFDASLQGSSAGIGQDARPTGSTTLANLSSPDTIAQLEEAMVPIAQEATSYPDLQCIWYAFGKQVTNDAKVAKANTVARFAMAYLKAADEIKMGTPDYGTISTLSSKLANSADGGYNGANATDSSMYKSILYGTPPIPSPFGLLYYLDTFDLIGAMMPAWTQIMASATAVGGVTNVNGSLTMPPLDMSNNARDYCLGGETQQNHLAYKTDNIECQPEITASAPPGWQGAMAPVLEVGRQTCPQTHYDQVDRQTEGGPYAVQPSLKATSNMLSPYVAGLFGANVMAWANAINLFFKSSTTGIPAGDAMFAGTGEILGNMAQSRGMMPSNAAYMSVYLAQKSAVEKNYADVARYDAKKTPFDVYNQYSFLGSIVHNLTPTYNASTPLFSTIANSLSFLGSGLKQLNPSANAIYYEQPDIFNPIRLSCMDPSYLSIGIMADAACNVRYSFSPAELAAQPDQVLNYMTQSHSDLTQNNITELQQRLATADTELDKANVQRMLTAATTAASQPEIDQQTGKPIANSEYSKFMNFCVNRKDPWGSSAFMVTTTSLSDQQKQKLTYDKDGNGQPISPNDSGDPYQKTPGLPYPAVTEGASADQDWYSGKKCTEQSEELTNFRAYTMLCSVDGSLSGGTDCTDLDNSAVANYSDDFFTSNDILYTSWY